VAFRGGQRQAVEQLALLVGPDVLVAVRAPEFGLAGLVSAQILFGVELGREFVDPAPFAQRARGIAPALAQFVQDPEIVPGQERVDRIERARIGPEFAQHVLEDALEHPGRMVEVDRGEHHVAGQYERLERDHAASVDAEDGGALAFDEPQRCDELIAVVPPALDAGEIGVAQQVVHAIGVEVRAAHQLAQVRIARLGTEDQREHVGGVDLERVDVLAQIGQSEDLARPLFVVFAEHGFARVAEGPVSDVVQDQRGAEQAALIRDVGVAREERPPLRGDRVERAGAHGERAQGVGEAGVLGRGIGQIGEAELSQTSESLHRGRVEQARLGGREFDEMMNRVENPLHGGEFSTGGRENPTNVAFDQSTIDEVRARTPIAEFIGQYVPLRKRGNDLVGLCPFHGEKTPSFHVHPDRGFYKCFGCGEGGNVFNFLQKMENLTFPDALRMLAAKAGVELTPETPGSARARSEKEAIYEANRIASVYFSKTLKSDAGARARAYLEKRGFTAATIETFGLGCAPAGWDGLRDELERNGVDLHLAAKAALVKPSQRGGWYDFYRDRLMVPTLATTGEVIAFGGRALGDEEPKYLNTSTTPVYTKGRHLFALNVAKRAAQREKTLIVVEGYLDCIALHQAGFDNAVASLGTSFTDEQAAELKKYADNVFLCFDGDAAGNAAAFKTIDIAMRVLEHAGRNVRVVGFPPGEDPDSYVRAHGADGFRALLAEAKPAIEFKLDPQIDRLATGFDSASAVARKAEGLIREMTPREEWDRWRVYVAGRLKVNVDDLRNSRFFANGANFAPAGGDPAGSRHAPAGVAPLSFEREVLSIVMEEPALAAEYGARIEPQRFRNAFYRGLYEKIVEQAGRLRETGDLYALFAGDQASLDALTELGSRDRSGKRAYGDTAERRAHLDRVIEHLQLEDARTRYGELSREIDRLYDAGQPVPDGLRREFDALVARLKK